MQYLQQWDQATLLMPSAGPKPLYFLACSVSRKLVPSGGSTPVPMVSGSERAGREKGQAI